MTITWLLTTTIMYSYSYSDLTMTTNACTLCTAILVVMVMCQYTTEHIYPCVMLRASIEATGRSNWSSIHSVSPQRLPWSWRLPLSLYRIFSISRSDKPNTTKWGLLEKSFQGDVQSIVKLRRMSRT